MSKRMTVQEKKEILMKIFTDSNEFYQLKDLLKLGSKKGIVENTIKPIVETLVSDSLILQEKIGTSQYYYLPFKHHLDPSDSNKKLLKTRNKLQELKNELLIHQQKIIDQKLLSEYQNISTQNNSLKSNLSIAEKKFQAQKYKNDIIIFEKMVQLYTNSIDEICSFTVNVFGVNRQEIMKNFDIPQEW